MSLKCQHFAMTHKIMQNEVLTCPTHTDLRIVLPCSLLSGNTSFLFCFIFVFFSFLLKELFPSGNFCPLISHAWRKPFFLVSHWASCQVSIQISQFVWNLPLVCTSTGANTHWPIQHSLEPYLISKNNSIAPNTLCIGYSVITYT